MHSFSAAKSVNSFRFLTIQRDPTRLSHFSITTHSLDSEQGIREVRLITTATLDQQQPSDLVSQCIRQPDSTRALSQRRTIAVNVGTTPFVSSLACLRTTERFRERHLPIKSQIVPAERLPDSLGELAVRHHLPSYIGSVRAVHPSRG